MKYLVTGGTGFIGASAVGRLIDDGHEVRVLDNNLRGSVDRLSRWDGNFEYVQGDIRDAELVDTAAKGVDAVMHLAYVNGTHNFYERPELVLDVAVRGMLNVVDACRNQDVGNLILASSSEVYQKPPIIPTDETVPLIIPDVSNPRFSYGGGKILCELMAFTYGRKGFDRVTIFRPHNVYGPDMGNGHVLPQFVARAKQLIASQPEGCIDFEIQGSGEETRSFVHIDNFIDGLMLVCDKGQHLEIYNIGNEEERSITSIVESLFSYLERDYKVVTGQKLQGSVARRCPDLTKLRDLGYVPSISFEDGFPSLIDWYLENA